LSDKNTAGISALLSVLSLSGLQLGSAFFSSNERMTIVGGFVASLFFVFLLFVSTALFSVVMFVFSWPGLDCLVALFLLHPICRRLATLRTIIESRLAGLKVHICEITPA
jgi:hypothetical protein